MFRRVSTTVMLGIAALTLMIGVLAGASGSATGQGLTGGSWPAGPFPAHIHSGTCNQLGDIVFPLITLEPFGTQATAVASPSVSASPVPATPVGTPEVPQDVLAQSTTVVEAPLDEIMGAQHAINVHESAENMQNYVACGDLAGAPVGDQVEIQLQELNESSLVGNAVLVDNGDGTTTVTVRVMVKESDAQFGTEEAPLPIEDGATPEN